VAEEFPAPRAARSARGAARTPQALLAYAFAGMILVGSGLLLLPWCHHGYLAPLDALFTATSAVCVTGLVVVDTGTAFTPAGQVVILLLIQAGGLGVMTFAALAYRLLGRRISLRAHTALQDALVQEDLGMEFRFLFRAVLRLVLLIELVGAVVLFVGLLPTADVLPAAGSAVFHAVSAFCNAGFSLRSDSLMGLGGRGLVIVPVMALIVLGGLGHPVLLEIGRALRRPFRRAGERRLKPFTLHAKLVLGMTLILIVGGALLLWATGLPANRGSFGGSAGDAMFQSVTARTAGFNSVDMGALPSASILVLCLLMFVGGSPCSCAGGIKTTTVAVWSAHMWAWLRGRTEPTLLGREIPGEILRRAGALIGLACLWNLVGVLVLAHAEQADRLGDVLFEQISAFGTVGLSTGITSGLTAVSKIWIVLTMFVGRLGPLTLVLCVFDQQAPNVRCPEGRVMIG
jgi:trk system potassium uptake protein TrkH